jgi:uncharacterized membrane protein YfcA
VREGYSNIRIAMFLEMATTLGALTGAYLGKSLEPRMLSIVFGLILLFSAYLTLRSRRQQGETDTVDPLAMRLRLDSSYPTPEGRKPYHVHGVPLGFGLMYVAGCISGLLGIGSGALKVLAMDQAMRIPFKVSTTTSNFMIGVTAAASAGVYLHSGYIVPSLAMPVMLGVLIGSLLGARVLMAAKSRLLRRVFSAVIFALAIEMIYKGWTGEM